MKLEFGIWKSIVKKTYKDLFVFEVEHCYEGCILVTVGIFYFTILKGNCAKPGDKKMKSIVDVRYEFNYPEDYTLLGLSSHAGQYVAKEIVNSHIESYNNLFSRFQQQENEIKKLNVLLAQEREAITRAVQSIEQLKHENRLLKATK